MKKFSNAYTKNATKRAMSSWNGAQIILSFLSRANPTDNTSGIINSYEAQAIMMAKAGLHTIV